MTGASLISSWQSENLQKRNGPINRVLLLILVHVLLLSCLFFWLLASLRLKTVSMDVAQLFMKEMVGIYFGLLKIQVKFLINWSLGVF